MYSRSCCASRKARYRLQRWETAVLKGGKGERLQVKERNNSVIGKSVRRRTPLHTDIHEILIHCLVSGSNSSSGHITGLIFTTKRSRHLDERLETNLDRSTSLSK